MKKVLIYVSCFIFLTLCLIGIKQSLDTNKRYKQIAIDKYNLTCLENNNNYRVMIKKGNYRLQLGKTNNCILPDQQFRSVLVILDLGIEVPVKIGNIEYIK